MAEPKQTNKERLREITESIEQGIKELFESEKYMQYLRVMSRFHRYSVYNITLIHLQNPHATHVAGFNKWRDQFGRHVKRGEKGIKIIAPTPYKKKIEEIKRDPDTKAPVLDKNGNAVMEEKEISIPRFKVVSVFDVSQTEGRPLPQLASDLTGSVRNYEIFMEALRRASPMPLEIRSIQDAMDGYFDPENQSITLRDDMSEVQTVCAAIHEITHSKLHNYEKERLAAAVGDDTKEPPKPKDRHTEEVEAESVSYAVCQYYGIETGENSFGYIANWSSGKELPELRASLETIQKTANGLITDIDRHFLEICKERGIDLTVQQEVIPEVDSIELFAADLYEYMDRLYQDGVTSHPISLDSKEQTVADLAHELHHGEFSNLRDRLSYMSGLEGAPSAEALLYRLDKLEREREAELSYRVHDNPQAVNGQEASYIQAYEKSTDGEPVPREIIFAGSREQCDKILEQLNAGLIGYKDVWALGDLPLPEPGQIEPPHRYYITQEALGHGTYPAMDGSKVHETPELHLYENSRIEAYGYIEYPQALTPEQIKESGLVPAEVAATMQAEKLYALDDAVYLHLQTSENGYDYTLYDINTLRELDGGQLDAPELPFSTACLQICEMHNIGSQSIKYAPVAMIETLQEAAVQQLQQQAAEPAQEDIRKSYMAHANPRATGEHDRYYIQAYDSTPGGSIGAEIVGYGTKELCEEMAGQLNSGVIPSNEAVGWLEAGQMPVQQEEVSTDAETPPASMLPDAPEQALDEYPMPDETLSVADLEACGYLDGDMLPLSKEQAMELFDKELTVYAIVDGGSAEMLFDREDFDTQAPEILFAVSREEWEASPLFHEKIMERHDHQEEREAAFLAHEGDCFAIYQVKDDDPQRLRFMNMDWLQSHGLTVERANYDLVYTGELTADGSTGRTLEALYEQFNLHHPADYHHPSMSVSDIIAVKQNGVVSCHYCDSFGFQEISGFLPQDNPLRNAEMMLEDDYGMIDGIINNGPKEPTVAELEQQARSGQPISLMDLADAVHREQREKKKSVVEQLKAKPKQEHKKAAPKRSAEREL